MKDKIKERVLLASNAILAKQSNVRDIAKELGVSKSTIHKDLSERLSQIDYYLWKKIQILFEQNKSEKHLRGGETTKQKYRK